VIGSIALFLSTDSQIGSLGDLSITALNNPCEVHMAHLNFKHNASKQRRQKGKKAARMTALENKLKCFANGKNRIVATNQIYFLMVSTSPNTNDCQ
jgi:hypothetical protein